MFRQTTTTYKGMCRWKKSYIFIFEIKTIKNIFLMFKSCYQSDHSLEHFLKPKLKKRRLFYTNMTWRKYVLYMKYILEYFIYTFHFLAHLHFNLIGSYIVFFFGLKWGHERGLSHLSSLTLKNICNIDQFRIILTAKY